MTMKIDGKRWVSMPVAVLISLLAATVSVAVAFGAFQQERKTALGTLENHENRIQKVETRLEDLREMKNDISWIKQTMQEDRQRRKD